VSKVLELESLDIEAQSSVWRIANVKMNSGVKGRKLTKKQRSALINIPLMCIAKVNIHAEF
jgi:hypothetical protein